MAFTTAAAAAPAPADPRLSQLTLEEKISLLSGNQFNTTPGIPRLGIPQIKVADSINGIRPSDPSGEQTTTCFPSTTCLASTWDVQLLGRLGSQLAHQAKLKSAQVVLGPTINMHRDPRGGRNFECFSEDPLLSGQLAGAIVNGIQQHGVGACPKHFVCNDSETLRHHYNVAESPHGRALREIYLAAWQHLLRISDPVAIMLAYNKVDGVFCTESKTLVTNILRGTWGCQSATISDWFAVHDTVGPIRAGLDLEMPFPIHRGTRLLDAVRKGLVREEAEVDTAVTNMLRLRDRTTPSHQDEPERSELSDEACKLALELASDGIVLLKNEANPLPLDPLVHSKVAVIGEFATNPPITGGGSASCRPQYTQNPLALLRSAFQTVNPNSEIYHAPGVRTNVLVPIAPTALLQSPSGSPGVEISYFSSSSSEEAAPQPIFTETLPTPHIPMLGPKPFPPSSSSSSSSSHVTLTTALTPLTTGTHTLAVRCTGSFILSLDNTPILAHPEPPKSLSTSDFLFHPHLYERRVSIPHMRAGTPYQIFLRMDARSEPMADGEPTPYGLMLCFDQGDYSDEEEEEEEKIRVACAASQKADVAIIFAGRSSEHESEGFDLESIKLPGAQARMIRAITAAVRPKKIPVVVVLFCGNPIDVEDWIDNGVDAVVNAHFPGQEGAQAIVDVLMGWVNPSGRLATTWWKGLERSGSFGWFPARKDEDGGGEVVIRYGEGVGVGYRRGDCEGVRWGFGFGLSYTEFGYAGLQVEVLEEKGLLRCAVVVCNRGAREGREVVQLYVLPDRQALSVWRPEKELKAFTKIGLGGGESRHVVLEVDLKVACSYWDEKQRCWRMEKGTYWAQIGDCLEEFAVSDTVEWDPYRTIGRVVFGPAGALCGGDAFKSCKWSHIDALKQ